MRFAGLILLAVGVMLLVMGLNASDSLQSELSEALKGTPSGRSIWLMAGGGVTGLVGLFLLLSPGRRPR